MRAYVYAPGPVAVAWVSYKLLEITGLASQDSTFVGALGEDFMGELRGAMAACDDNVASPSRRVHAAGSPAARGGSRRSSRPRLLSVFQLSVFQLSVLQPTTNWLLLVRGLRRQHRANLRDDAEAAWARARAVRHGCRGGGLLVASIGGGHELVP